MDETNDLRSRVESALYGMGWDDMDAIDDWDGEDLESLREFLNDDEFEAVCDELDWEAPLELELETSDD